MALDIVPKRQLDIGPAKFFEPYTLATPGNGIRVYTGFMYSGGRSIYDRTTAGVQTTAGFASVSAGLVRWDLVYLNSTGAATIQAGTAVTAAVGAATPYTGGPGFTGGPQLKDNAIPVAYVFVDETGTPSVSDADITQVNGFLQVTRDFEGYYTGYGKLVANHSIAIGTSNNTVVTTAFATKTPGGNATTAGVCTIAPFNICSLLDQKNDSIMHTTGAQVFGVLSHAGVVWTLHYFYVNGSGATTAVTNIATDTTLGAGLTDIELARVPEVFSRNDSARPLFAAGTGIMPVVDQIAGDIPMASTTQAGKVQLSNSVLTTAGLVVQASDTRMLIANERNAITAANIAAAGGGGAPTSANPLVVHDDSRLTSLTNIQLVSKSAGYSYARKGGEATNGGPARFTVLWTQSDESHNATLGTVVDTYDAEPPAS